MQKRLLFQSSLDLFLAILIGNLLALPFLFLTFYQLPASNVIRIGIKNFPDSDENIRNWYRDKSIEPIEITREDSILRITYNAKLGDDWKTPNSIELENMGYTFSGTFVFSKNPYSEIFADLDKASVSSVLERLPIDLGRLLIILALATQTGFLLIGWWRRRRMPKDETIIKSSTAKAILFGLMTGLGLFGIGIIHDQVIRSIFGVSADSFGIWGAVKKLSLFERITIILLGSLLAPFCEELFFRGVMFARYLQAGFPWFGLIFTSIIFASVHLDLINIFAYFLFGVILALLYWKTKNLTASVVAHGVNNAIALILLIYL